MERLKTLEEMPGALSYLIEKVEGLEKTAQSLLNRQDWLSSEGLTSCHPSIVPT